MRVPILQHFASRLCRSERSRWLISNVHVGSRIYRGAFNIPQPNIERSHSTGPASSVKDGQTITPTTFQWSPLSDGNNGSSESPTVSAPRKSFFGVLCSAIGGATHEHLQRLASAVMVPGHGSSILSRADALPADSGWIWNSRQIVEAMERVDFNSTDAADLARELVAATLLAAKTRTRGPGARQWARGLLGSALYQYREIDGRLELEDGDFGLKCFDMYAQMLDLLVAWNLCCEMHQTTAENHNYSGTTGGEIDVEAQKSTYQRRLMSFLPGWSSLSSSSASYKVSAECEQDLVFASFITLALITKLRYRMLRGLDADTGAVAEAGAGAGPLASTDASLLNLRNVSLPEAAFLRLVGQAGQGTPFNRIHLRLAWARIGCSPAESLSIGRTIENLHAYHDYLLMEAERCFSQAAGTRTKAGSVSGAGAGLARARSAEEEEKGLSSPDANAMVPAPLLAWIHYADAPALIRFRDGLSKSSSISVHVIWPELLSAITRRFITIGRQQQRAEDSDSGSNGAAGGDILRTLKVWVALGQSGPCESDALKVLDHFQEAHDDMSYAAAWSMMRKCQQDGSLEAHFQDWVRHLWAQKEYDRVVSLHRRTVQLLSEKLSGDNDYACSLTHICLELHIQDPARGVYVQRMFHNLVRVGIEPDRQMWRQWMRVKLMASEFLNAVRALWRYKMCDGEGDEEDFGEEACIYLAARLDKMREDKRVLLKNILFDISRAISIGLKHADCERLYMLREAGAVPLAAQARVISLHEQLVRSVCELQPKGPNRLKVAAAVHMHLVHCIRVEELAEDLAAQVSRLEETITAAFWKGGRDEQMRMLCKQRYDKAWPPRWARLPVVKSQKLVRAWLASGLAQRHLTFDLGYMDYADVGTHLAHLMDIGKKKEKADDVDDDDNNTTVNAAAARKFFRDTAAQVKFKEGESLKFGASERRVEMAEEVNKANEAEAEKGAHGSSSSGGGGGTLPIRHVPLRKKKVTPRVRKP